MAEYDLEEMWSVVSAIQALKQSGHDLTADNINDWLKEHKGEEHAYGEYEPVDNEKIASILKDRGVA